MSDAGAKTLYLIDGHAQFFRAYHAIRNGMTSPVTREPTNLTFGFMGMFLKLLRDRRPDYLAVVIDAAGDRETFRSEMYPEYKANRPPPPDDFRPQVKRCLELLDLFHVPVLAEPGVEADDVLASLVRLFRRDHPDLRIRIVSRDKDLTQITGEGVELYDAYKEEVVTPADVFKTEGVQAEHVVDILALMGDSVDNVPGVDGIGPKTAAKLILQYGTIENLLAHIDEIKGKRRENIEAARDRLPLSKRLVELKHDLDVELDLDRARSELTALPVDEILPLFQQLGFNAHADTVRELARGGQPGAGVMNAAAPGDGELAFGAPSAPARAPSPPRRDDGEGSLFAGLGDPDDTPPDAGDYRAITDVAALDAFVTAARQAGRFAVRCTLDRRSPIRGRLCGIALAVDVGDDAPPDAADAWYVPLLAPGSDHLDEACVLERLAPILADESITVAGHNLKRDIVVLRRRGLDVRGPIADPMIASFLVDATRSSHDVAVLALALLGRAVASLEPRLGRGKKRKTIDELALDDVVPALAEEADVILRLVDVLEPQIEALTLGPLYRDVELPLSHVLAELELNGIRVDRGELDRQRVLLAARIDDLGRRIAASAPHAFNPDSPKQLAAALFNKPEDDPPGLGLKVLKRGKTGPSTDQEVLEKLEADPDVRSEVPALILEHRQLQKLVSTYLVALAAEIDPDTGRVHASFNQIGAQTGRLSSSDPNLQNIPIRTEVGREIRRAFVAEPGHLLVTADYSQIELRLLAHLSGDPALAEAFRSGLDIHVAVAAEVFGVEPDAVTPDQRTTAKMVNFGIVYGITPWGLARRLGPDVPVDEAKRIIDDYKARFHHIDGFLADCIAQAEMKGYVETMMKRRRLIPQIRARHPQQRALGERMAINTVVQGSAADLIKVAMIDLSRRLPERFPGSRMLLQIHDELVFEAVEEEAAPLEAFARERMEAAMELDVPLVVDTARSTRWIDAK